ncbi:hypothetical protein DIPPA_35037, partial [Diplonema papillatum]
MNGKGLLLEEADDDGAHSKHHLFNATLPSRMFGRSPTAAPTCAVYNAKSTDKKETRFSLATR